MIRALILRSIKYFRPKTGGERFPFSVPALSLLNYLSSPRLKHLRGKWFRKTKILRLSRRQLAQSQSGARALILTLPPTCPQAGFTPQDDLDLQDQEGVFHADRGLLRLRSRRGTYEARNARQTGWSPRGVQGTFKVRTDASKESLCRLSPPFRPTTAMDWMLNPTAKSILKPPEGYWSRKGCTSWTSPNLRCLLSASWLSLFRRNQSGLQP